MLILVFDHKPASEAECSVYFTQLDQTNVESQKAISTIVHNLHTGISFFIKAQFRNRSVVVVVCVCVCACERACVRACVRARARGYVCVYVNTFDVNYIDSHVSNYMIQRQL